VSYELVVDQERKPLDPVHPGHARLLLNQGKAAVWRRIPFTLIVKATALNTHPTPLRVEVDPGSKITGLAVVNDTSGQVAWAAQRERT
jgi:hypothetical protein